MNLKARVFKSFILGIVLVSTPGYAKERHDEYQKVQNEFDTLDEDTRKWLHAQSISIKNISDHYLESSSFKATFAKIDKISEQDQKSCLIGSLPQNRKKNRHKRFIPFDKYLSIKNEDDFYINASDVVSPVQCYMVTQGPFESTVEDFWKALIKKGSSTVVSLVMKNEGRSWREKCANWWDKKRFPLFIDNWTVQFESEETILYCPNVRQSLIKRTFIAKNKARKVHYIAQYHYEHWRDHDVPYEELFSFLLDHIDATHMDPHVPITVHCSAGVGRSGTFVAAHSLRKEYRQLAAHSKHPSAIRMNIPKRLLALRFQRRSLVSTLDQYRFIFKILKRELFPHRINPLFKMD